jgi:hypothetical protein
MHTPAARDPLCRFAGRACAACCWGEGVSYPALCARLRRQTGAFARRFAGRSPPGWWDLFLHELTVRGAADVFWGVLLLVPLLGDQLRPVLARRLTCAFLGYEDERRERVGCLLHPSRWEGKDVRRGTFALLSGIGCGHPDWYCLAAHFFAAAPPHERRRFEDQSRGLGWYAYSRLASRFRPARLTQRRQSLSQISTMTSASQPPSVRSTRRP